MSPDAQTLTDFIGKELGVSGWVHIDQGKIDAHAELTGDDGWIHTDVERAKRESPFGNTIAQGFLLLSHLTQLAKSLDLPVTNIAYRLNYGFDRIRIIRPVLADSRIRAQFQLKDVRSKGDDAVVATLEAKIETDRSDDPALLAEWLTYIRFAS